MEEKSAFVNDENIYGKDIKSIPKPEPEIGIDSTNSFYDNIMMSVGESGQSTRIDMTQIDSFSNISQNRDQVYTLLDTMAQDSKVSAILETYAADATETMSIEEARAMTHAAIREEYAKI